MKTKKNQELLRQFVECFSSEDEEEIGFVFTEQTTDRQELNKIYDVVPFRFPQLFEELLLTYRWDSVSVGNIRLLPNPAGAGFDGFLSSVLKDKFMFEFCLKHRYLQFGRGAAPSYDPVCFSASEGVRRRNYGVVVLDHESILCHSQTREISQLAASFEEFVGKTIRERG